jgi:hypothetical protein
MVTVGGLLIVVVVVLLAVLWLVKKEQSKHGSVISSSGHELKISEASVEWTRRCDSPASPAPATPAPAEPRTEDTHPPPDPVPPVYADPNTLTRKEKKEQIPHTYHVLEGPTSLHSEGETVAQEVEIPADDTSLCSEVNKGKKRKNRAPPPSSSPAIGMESL